MLADRIHTIINRELKRGVKYFI